MNCKNCEHIVDGNFCPHCGQSTKITEINLSYFLNELPNSIFQINRGLFYSLKELFVRPGQSIREYLSGKRKNHFKPIAYAFLLSTIYFLLSQLLESKTFLNDLTKGFSNESTGSKMDTYALTILDWCANHYAFTMLLTLPFYSLASYIAFLGSGFNYLKHVVLNAYIIGQQAIFYSLASILSLTTFNDSLLVSITLCFSISYAFVVFWQFFSKQSRVTVILRSLLSYVVFWILFLLVTFLIGLGSTMI